MTSRYHKEACRRLFDSLASPHPRWPRGRYWGRGKEKKTQVFWHQSEARTAATVWNWSGKTLSPGALLAVLYFAPGSPRMPPALPPLFTWGGLRRGLNLPMNIHPTYRYPHVLTSQKPNLWPKKDDIMYLVNAVLQALRLQNSLYFCTG